MFGNPSLYKMFPRKNKREKTINLMSEQTLFAIEEVNKHSNLVCVFSNWDARST